MWFLNEFTRGDILKAASPEPWRLDMKQRSSIYTIAFVKVILDPFENNCIVVFDTTASGHSKQRVSVSIDDFWPTVERFVKDKDEFKTSTILDLVLNQGDIHTHCTCPSWVYGGYNYIATQLDYALWQKENRPPKVRNPKMMGSCCKHIYIVLKYLANNRLKLAAEINNQIKSNKSYVDYIDSLYIKAEN